MVLSRLTSSRNKVDEAKQVLKYAKTYDEWREAATELDRLEGKDEWKQIEVSDDYNYKLIRERLNELRRLRGENDIERLVYSLHEGLHGNLGNIANPALYSHCRVGTKQLIEDYLNEVCASLNYLCDTQFDTFSSNDKSLFFRRTGHSFGRSALMLSGGATLGVFHLGVIKALWDQKLLPRVLSGSSAGSIIAGAVGVHSDDELASLFDPKYMSLTAFRLMSVRGAVQGKSLMDGSQLMQTIRDNVGDLTFEEAFERTGRIVNITVSPVEANQQSRLMNYLSSPHTLVRSASLASCAIPGVFPAVQLQAKSLEGDIIDYMPGTKWADGSLHSDLPMLRVGRLHNVNHYLVSQANPHVIPFLTEKKNVRKGMLPFARQAVVSSVNVYGKHLIKLARENTDSSTLGMVLEKVDTLSNQQYSGDITIFPREKAAKYLQIFSNLTHDGLQRFIDEGERETWPKIERIRNASKISRTFESCLQRLKDRGDYRAPAVDIRRAANARSGG